LRESEAGEYATYFELAKRCLSERHVDAAIEHLRKAISISPERPEAYNLLGAIHEIRHEIPEAVNNYRAALSYDATYEPSRLNLARATSRNVWDVHPQSRPILLGELRENLKDKA
jgi:Flp pilus assembly protein TadD